MPRAQAGAGRSRVVEAHHWAPTCPRPTTLVQPVRLDPSGERGPTRGQARGKKWRQVAWGWYVPADADSNVVEQRILEAAARLPAHSAVSAWAALRWRGATFFDGLGDGGRTRLPVPLLWAAISRRIRASWSATNSSHRVDRVGGRSSSNDCRARRVRRDAPHRVGTTGGRGGRHGHRRRADRPGAGGGVHRHPAGVDGRADDPPRAAAGKRGQSFAAGDPDAPDLGPQRRATDARLQPAGVRPRRQAPRDSGPVRPGGGVGGRVRRRGPPCRGPARATPYARNGSATTVWSTSRSCAATWARPTPLTASWPRVPGRSSWPSRIAVGRSTLPRGGAESDSPARKAPPGRHFWCQT